MVQKFGLSKLTRYAFAIALISGSFSDLIAGSNFTITKDDSTEIRLVEFQRQINQIKSTSISGYLQAQFQYADSSGIESYEGGSFAPNVDKRFQIRRARFRITHEEKLGVFTIQIDGNERGVKVMDFYGRLTDP